jgi:hypothetical protein
VVRGPLGQRERSELRVAKPLAQRTVSNFPAGVTPAAKSPLLAGPVTPTAPRAGGFPRAPAPAKPRVERSSPALFSADSQHTWRPDGVWWFCRP